MDRVAVASTIGAKSVEYLVDGDVAILRIANAPVNALSLAVRTGLAAALDAAEDDASVNAIIITGAAGVFSGGADIAEFNASPAAPTLASLTERIEAIGKPMVAAIAGVALGGGLELALACRYRVVSANARLGLPEVRLGLIPGAGGTVRLPHLIGATRAFEMVVGGEPVTAQQALSLGLADHLVDDAADLVVASRELLGRHTGDRRASRLTDDATDFESAVAAALRKARGLEAPAAVVEAFRNALTMSQTDALTAERAIFSRLRTGAQSAAQRHLFFAERAATKVDIASTVAPRSVNCVGVIGAGTMGTGIAMSFANAGLSVRLFDADAGALERGLSSIEKTYAKSVANGSTSEAVADQRRSAIVPVAALDGLAQCDLVVEAAFEDIEVKRTLFAALDRVMPAGAILATNTSYLDVNHIAAATERPRDVVGLHFFSPAQVMKLLEVVRASATAPDVILTAIALAKRLGKVLVIVGVGPGFVGNRMLGARSTDLIDLLLEGAEPHQVDAAFTDFGWAMGPFAMQDLAGLDIAWRNRKASGSTLAIADQLCELGHFGQKTGRGYYRYAPGSRLPQPDPDLQQLVTRTATTMGITRRAIDAQEIVERTLFPMINEGYRLLDGGIAARSSDIDLVWVHGYGFPRGLGGPMFWAERHGLAHIVARLDACYERSGKEVFQLSSGLRARADAHPPTLPETCERQDGDEPG